MNSFTFYPLCPLPIPGEHKFEQTSIHTQFTLPEDALKQISSPIGI